MSTQLSQDSPLSQSLLDLHDQQHSGEETGNHSEDERWETSTATPTCDPNVEQNNEQNESTQQLYEAQTQAFQPGVQEVGKPELVSADRGGDSVDETVAASSEQEGEQKQTEQKQRQSRRNVLLCLQVYSVDDLFQLYRWLRSFVRWRGL